MIKKITAYTFIVIANLVILAHAVIPHHHNESVVCIEQKHSYNDGHNHDVNEPLHHHEGDANTDCILKHALFVPDSKGNLLKNCPNYADSHSFYILLA